MMSLKWKEGRLTKMMRKSQGHWTVGCTALTGWVAEKVNICVNDTETNALILSACRDFLVVSMHKMMKVLFLTTLPGKKLSC